MIVACSEDVIKERFKIYNDGKFFKNLNYTDEQKRIKRIVFKNFKCLRCGKCCTEIDNIDLSKEDIYRISKFLKITNEQFIIKYTNSSLTSNSGFCIKPPCVFYNDKKCDIYKVRPIVCKGYPFNGLFGMEPRQTTVACHNECSWYKKDGIITW